MHQSGIGEREPAASVLGELLGSRGLRSEYQPIVDLETGALFGFEALARGPEGSALERPDQLLAVARTEGRLAELDAACQRTAIAGADTHTVKAPLTCSSMPSPTRPASVRFQNSAEACEAWSSSRSEP